MATRPSPATSRCTSPRSARAYLTRDEVPAETVENERRVAEATAREEGKPEAALPKIVEGRVNGFFKENVLLEQPFAKDAKKTVGKVLDEAGAKASALRPLPRRRLSVHRSTLTGTPVAPDGPAPHHGRGAVGARGTVSGRPLACASIDRPPSNHALEAP